MLCIQFLQSHRRDMGINLHRSQIIILKSLTATNTENAFNPIFSNSSLINDQR